jgi:hypothetical protein
MWRSPPPKVLTDEAVCQHVGTLLNLLQQGLRVNECLAGHMHAHLSA